MPLFCIGDKMHSRIHLIEGRAKRRQQGTTYISQLRRMFGTFEQTHIKRVFKDLNLTADGAVCNVELLGSEFHQSKATSSFEGTHGVERWKTTSHVQFPYIGSRNLSFITLQISSYVYSIVIGKFQKIDYHHTLRACWRILMRWADQAS